MDACLVLDQRRAALTTLSQGTHGLAMGFLRPRLHLQLSPGIAQRLLVLSPPLVVCGQVLQCLQRLATSRSRSTTSHCSNGALGNENPAISSPRYSPVAFPQPLLYTTGSSRCCGARAPGREPLPSQSGPRPPSSVASDELQGMAGSQDQRWIAVGIRDCLAQAVERLPQVLQRYTVGLLGPQQAGQCLAPAGDTGVQYQIGQQGPGAVGAKAFHRLAVYPSPGRSCRKRISVPLPIAPPPVFTLPLRSVHGRLTERSRLCATIREKVRQYALTPAKAGRTGRSLNLRQGRCHSLRLLPKGEQGYGIDLDWQVCDDDDDQWVCIAPLPRRRTLTVPRWLWPGAAIRPAGPCRRRVHSDVPQL